MKGLVVAMGAGHLGEALWDEKMQSHLWLTTDALAGPQVGSLLSLPAQASPRLGSVVLRGWGEWGEET